MRNSSSACLCVHVHGSCSACWALCSTAEVSHTTHLLGSTRLSVPSLDAWKDLSCYSIISRTSSCSHARHLAGSFENSDHCISGIADCLGSQTVLKAVGAPKTWQL